MHYTDEVEQFIKVLQDKSEVPNYFIQLFKCFEESNKGKKVGIVGDEFYSLYVRAFNLTPVLISGGSYYTGENASHIFPQISDPVAKSTLGLLLDKDLNLLEELCAVIITASNDSYKKVIYYLQEQGVNVIKVDPPPYLLNKMPLSYVMFQVSLLNEISKIRNTRMSYAVLQQELKGYQKAYELTKSPHWQAIPTLVQNFFLQTLHMAKDKETWCQQLQQYLHNIEPTPKPPTFLLVGSVLKFPSTKMYEIFNDIGITHFENQCLGLPNFQDIPDCKTSFGLLYECCKFQYDTACVAQTLVNSNNYDFTTDAQGIVYYLLKGQVAEAFEAEQLEKTAIKQSIPFLCIETDYTNTDKEQIKIRVEAFYEMLNKRAAVAIN
ncbi:MAG: hypothetical protein BEN18_06290 [Epulopiscium sp. Nuni2H_MBin001]|nr:MAG: hypothetical protein BEN18_06290 [Epulopiscium sp. Nuni2H_MBin001]